MRVLALWRYPVKSMQGEPLDQVGVGDLGLAGDRAYRVLDPATGLVLTARRHPALLHGAGRHGPDGSIEVLLPDGSVADGDEALSAWLGRPVRLERAGTGVEPTYESDDRERWGGPAGAFHDDGSVRVSLVGTATVGRLGDWDLRRFRPNIVVDGDEEDGLVGRRVRLGSAILDVVQPVVRCVMVTRLQPGGIARDLDVLRTILRERAGTLAVGAVVIRAGTIAVGDEIEVLT